ncbi:Ubiquitin carboxyl-terminal hydrolase 34 [Colletotrichum sidae]|uniref:Ubiquitin carboxyl-terminal hydrolase 34 n=1 Tax=Colletotrichum sidae TaxID=1347389 RepID=A0A4R8TEF5_9PEZI|nr:Ubiquitin carboxyl-terminal hydrolase 34 [Colletotrichum sidae]
MDQPTGSSEAPDRALSSEPSSTRPNPFAEGDVTSRKRQRTSISGGSRSRSADSNRSDPDTSSSPAIDIIAEDINTQGSAMKIDTGPSTPQTPELQSTAREPPAEPPSSRVTINLRNAAQSENSSSPVSPTPQALLAQSKEARDGVKKSVEQLDEVDMVQAPIEITDTPPSTSSSVQSPDVEVIAVPDDDQDADFDDEVSMIRDHGIRLDAAAEIDPTSEFPYHEMTDSFQTTVAKLVTYFSNQAPPEDSVLLSMRRWLEAYIDYVNNVGVKAAYESHHDYLDLWLCFPEIVWVLSNTKLFASREGRHNLAGFFIAFSKLVSIFVEFDMITAQAFHLSLRQERVHFEFLLVRYAQPLILIVRREDSRLHSGQPDGSQWSRATDVSEALETFQSRCGNLKGLLRLAQLHISNSSADALAYPNLMDTLVPICNIAAAILQKTLQSVRSEALPERLDIARARFADGHEMYQLISEAFSTVLEKNVTQLSNDTAKDLIVFLSDILKVALHGTHKLAAELKLAHQQSQPKLTDRFMSEAISMQWRLGMLRKLITSSQMQLRVTGAASMCQDLVSCWKKYGDTDGESHTYLSYLAEYLLGTKLVDYILGPTCHPEITAESGNIVGFLIMTRYYRNEQTDLLWQTITTAQDPRIAEALVRMINSIANLFQREELLYLCEKFNGLQIDFFTLPVRNFCDAIVKNLHTRTRQDGGTPSTLPLTMLIRLVRESSVYASGSRIAHPEVHQFGLAKFKEMARDVLDADARKAFYTDCLEDIAAKSSTTLGTLCCLSSSMRPLLPNELRVLTAEHNLTALLVDELEHAIEQAKKVGYPTVLCDAINAPRRDFIACILLHEPATITSDLGPRLWDMLVGHSALSDKDRTAGWSILNNVAQPLGNPFLSVCFTDYLPTLPRDCLCEGALAFVRNAILPRVDDINGVNLDDTESLSQSGVEQLWRIILDVDAGDPGLLESAIQTLVGDIYINSKTILEYPHHRARRVHLGLVNRCLNQMEDAAKRLEASNEGTRSGDGDPMVIVVTDEQMRTQERIFTRSLAVLRHFLSAHQSKVHFCAPDLRALTPVSPSVPEGESAQLKFQSFDGDKQTDILPLEVGRQNTAASLLASIRQATGFDNYRIYYRGRPFSPRETDVCRSLEDLKIHDGLILVKREENDGAAVTSIKPGASLLEIEIMGHFEQLWNYLSMQEVLAEEIHAFLIKLPANAHMTAAFDSADTPYRQVFPPGQPFKSLYALYAMKEYINTATHRLKEAASIPSDDERAAPEAYLEALMRVRRLIVAAVADPEIIESGGSDHLKNRLGFILMYTYMLSLKEPPVASSSSVKAKPVAIAEAGRLVEILSSAVTSWRGDHVLSLIGSTFTAIVQSVSISSEFWASFRALPNLDGLFGTLLLDLPSSPVRGNTAKLIEERIISPEESTENMRSFRQLLWPILCNLLPKAVNAPTQCGQVFKLTQALLRRLVIDDAEAVDVPGLARQCAELLLNHDSSEHLGNEGAEDAVASGLVHLLWTCLTGDISLDIRPRLQDHLGRHLFWKHLFPPPRSHTGSSGQSVILSPSTRATLTDTIFRLVSGSTSEVHALVRELESLVPFDEFDNDDSPYLYDLPMQFDRMTAVRAPCGYTGLRNLSNTCYLNSLFTQLFMNTGFRQFMISACDSTQSRLGPPAEANLLEETGRLFAFMQDSCRKYIDPSLLVGSIKTYEETPIDVHNQMDVDEFYNLLFDRWEGQLSTGAERKTLRSFYGGQLVQQVASKECEHISERLEPFSAIQCDIKGKSTLQDSLQAYVDGEIMEGDNKYKCSTCDRHVDAVKRACLKDIPDNLIFHLKRFDFNLRTLMRSKINDYFSFPKKIDMRPYTIDHLGSPGDSTEDDVFELVGVLVHAGTAESGHYYSYIRERPTPATTENWYEFNDDVVTPWNLADLEKAAFGGQDLAFDNGVYYDKTYSAYMLFYQRSSVLRAEQDRLRSESLVSPLKANVPTDIADYIMGENTLLLRRHCLYDPSHSKFVLRLFQHVRMLNGGVCSSMHNTEQRAMHMILGHLDQVVARAKDVPDFDSFQEEIIAACDSCERCALDFVGYYQERHTSFRQLLQRNPEGPVRFGTGSMLIRALSKIKEEAPQRWIVSQAGNGADECVLTQVLQLFESLWSNFHINIRSWPEVFQTILSFAQMGRFETALLLSEDWLLRVMRIVFAHCGIPPSFLLPNSYFRMYQNIGRRLSNTRVVHYDMVIQLIDHFFRSLEDVLDRDTIVDTPDMRLDAFLEDQTSRLPWTPEEASMLHYELIDEKQLPHGSLFIRKLVDLNQNAVHTASIIKQTMQLDLLLERKVHSVLINFLGGHIANYQMNPLITAAIVFSEISRSPVLVQSLFRHVVDECRCLQNAEGAAFLTFFKKAFASLQQGDEVASVDRYRLYIDQIPEWAPSLLGYYNSVVRQDTEGFIRQWLSKHTPGEDEDDRFAALANVAARRLGWQCLKFLRENYVQSRTQVTKLDIESLQSIIVACEPFYLIEVEGEDCALTYAQFKELFRSTIEPLRRITVEELDDEGSDWENSCGSSEQLGSLADINMQTAGDITEADL